MRGLLIELADKINELIRNNKKDKVKGISVDDEKILIDKKRYPRDFAEEIYLVEIENPDEWVFYETENYYVIRYDPDGKIAKALKNIRNQTDIKNKPKK